MKREERDCSRFSLPRRERPLLARNSVNAICYLLLQLSFWDAYFRTDVNNHFSFWQVEFSLNFSPAKDDSYIQKLWFESKPEMLLPYMGVPFQEIFSWFLRVPALLHNDTKLNQYAIRYNSALRLARFIFQLQDLPRKTSWITKKKLYKPSL